MTAIVGMVFEGERESNSSAAAEDNNSDADSSKQGGAIDTSVKCLVGLQTTLKSLFATAKNDSNVTTEQKADLRRACSECRRVCITAAITILTTKGTLSDIVLNDTVLSGVEVGYEEYR